MILTIAWREFRNLFLSPLAWALLASCQFIIGWLFLSQLDTYLQLLPRLAAIPGAPGLTDMVATPSLGIAANIMLMIAPLLTMRLIAEERRNGSLALLLSAPISLTSITLGKLFGLVGFFLVLVGLTLLMPLSLLAGGNLDLNQLIAGVLALILLLLAFCAIGLFISSMTSHPTVAGVVTFGVLLFLRIIDWAGENAANSDGVFTYLSMQHHLEYLLTGMFNSTDVIYFLLITGLFTGLTIWRLDLERQS